MAQDEGLTVETGAPEPAVTSPKVAIVIPTYNEEPNLGRLLRSIRSQSIPSEVIVVDQQSTDNTVEIARQYGCSVAHSPRPAFYTPPGPSRNKGAAMSRAPILIHL